MLTYMLSLKFGSGPSSCMYSSDSVPVGQPWVETLCLVAHPCLQPAHAAEPPVVVVGLAAAVREHLGMGQDQELLAR